MTKPYTTCQQQYIKLKMKCEEFIETLKKDYSPIKRLTDKNGAKAIVIRHKTLGKKIVLRQFEEYVEIYDMLKEIDFKNLPAVYDSYNFDDGQIVLEEYIDGITVADVLESGKYTYSGAAKVISEVCDALSVIHSKGYVHRDIKPENVMITTDATIKLIDFNASRKYDISKSNDTVALGTIGYASPEQLGLSQSDARTDIYALGVLLNVMLTGVHPSKCLASGRAGKIVLKCTQIDPQKRYSNTFELKYAL